MFHPTCLWKAHAGSVALAPVWAPVWSSTIPTGSWLKPAIWMNAPVVEKFAQTSPYMLCGGPDEYTVFDQRNGSRYPVDIPRQPHWYDRLTSRDIPMSQIGVLQGTYLGIYINPVCEFWRSDLNCRFCTTGQNVGGVEIAAKTVEDVVETCWAAKEESQVTFVHLNGGFQGGRALEFAEPFVRAIKEDVGMLVGVQLTPERDLSRYDRLIDMGVDHFSFCIELLDPSGSPGCAPVRRARWGNSSSSKRWPTARRDCRAAPCQAR